MIKYLLSFLISFIFSLILMPLIIKFLKRISVSQTILSYVEAHKEKNGTTTMGGVVFMISTLILSFFFLKYNTNWFMVLLFSLFFGCLGFMDDLLKVKYKHNLGLRPYQKLVGQLALSVIFALFVYFNIGSSIFIPFVNKTIDFGIFIVPIIVIVLIATTNSVNLTDGIDGLAGNVSLIYLIFFVGISVILKNSLYIGGETGVIIQNLENINVLSMLFIGSILGFLIFNTSKACIFMGDVGSLCLGGFIGASACLVGLEFIIPILGMCFVFSALSVILQVLFFKFKRKRIFKMAPFHHHLQMSGLSEPKIVIIYSSITAVLGCLCLIFYLL